MHRFSKLKDEIRSLFLKTSCNAFEDIGVIASLRGNLIKKECVYLL